MFKQPQSTLSGPVSFRNVIGSVVSRLFDLRSIGIAAGEWGIRERFTGSHEPAGDQCAGEPLVGVGEF